jgi:hypothetical protein
MEARTEPRSPLNDRAVHTARSITTETVDGQGRKVMDQTAGGFRSV